MKNKNHHDSNHAHDKMDELEFGHEFDYDSKLLDIDWSWLAICIILSAIVIMVLIIMGVI